MGHVLFHATQTVTPGAICAEKRGKACLVMCVLNSTLSLNIVIHNLYTYICTKIIPTRIEARNPVKMKKIKELRICRH
jgi:hypothetical protein